MRQNSPVTNQIIQTQIPFLFLTILDQTPLFSRISQEHYEHKLSKTINT